MKILYVFTVGGMSTFFPDLTRKLLDRGDQVDIACNDTDRVKQCYRDWNCGIYKLSCGRSPMSSGNRKAIKEIRELVERNQYDIVHCHSPVAAFCTRMACKDLREKNGLKVFYTAHGFHFFKGAPAKYWTVFYPLERMCSKWTDVLITINEEDYQRASRKMKADEVIYVPGVGVDIGKFRDAECDREALRNEIGLPEDAFMLLSVGALIDRKNLTSVMTALDILGNEKIHYVVVGEGAKEKEIKEYAASLKCADRIHFLGRREDIPQLCKAADCFILPSFQEGLPVALMEAMASGLPALGADIRGVQDLISSERRFAPTDYDRIAELVDKMYLSPKWREEAIAEDVSKIAGFSEETVNKQMLEIYGG